MWDREARRVLKLEMAGAEFTFKMLSDKLNELGFGINTPKTVAQRIGRGSFNFGFALRVLKVLGVESLDIKHVKLHARKKSG